MDQQSIKKKAYLKFPHFLIEIKIMWSNDMNRLDIRTYNELRDVIITTKCNRCNSIDCSLIVNWTHEILRFHCNECGYDNVLDQGIEI